MAISVVPGSPGNRGASSKDDPWETVNTIALWLPTSVAGAISATYHTTGDRTFGTEGKESTDDSQSGGGYDMETGESTSSSSNSESNSSSKSGGTTITVIPFEEEWEASGDDDW